MADSEKAADHYCVDTLPLVTPLCLNYTDLLNGDVGKCVSVVSRAFSPGGLGILCVRGLNNKLINYRNELYDSIHHLTFAYDAAPGDTIGAIRAAGLGSDVPSKPKINTVGKGKAALPPPLPATFAVTSLLKSSDLGSDTSIFSAGGERRARLHASEVEFVCTDSTYKDEGVNPDGAVCSEASTASSVTDTPAEGGLEGYARVLKSRVDPLGQLMISVTLRVLSVCDAWMERDMASTSFFRAAADGGSAKVRAIHYRSAQHCALHPHATTQPANLTSLGSWQGWHFDYGLVTALMAPQVSTDKATESAPLPLEGAPCGLVILHDVEGGHQPLLVSIPCDAVAIQIGETAQLLSGGRVQATPHAVARPPASETPHAFFQNACRQILVAFVQPSWETKLQPPGDAPQAFGSYAALESVIPPLQERWDDGITFADFSKRTTGAYYGKHGAQALKGKTTT